MADERGKPASSAARLAANRRNAQKSTGPKTPAGKRRAALNSQRRGLASPEIERQLQERGEDPDDFRRLHRDLVALFPPHEACDETAVRVLAETWWEKARRLRDGAGDGKPLTGNLDAKIEQLLMFLVNKQRERHERWHVRLTAVLGQGAWAGRCPLPWRRAPQDRAPDVSLRRDEVHSEVSKTSEGGDGEGSVPGGHGRHSGQSVRSH